MANTDDGSCVWDPLLITATVCDTVGVTSVRFTGPWWNWDPNNGPVGTSNGDGTWTFSLPWSYPYGPSNMQYLLVVNGVQENLIASMQNGGTCAPVTDYWSYANREWIAGSGNITGIYYGRCDSCDVSIAGCTDPTALNYDSTATVDDGSCIAIVYGCTDTAATNYYAGANVNDGSCTYGCSAPITNLGVRDIIHNRATFTFDDMNSSTCRVDQLRIKYREVGTSAWSQKNMGSPTGYDPVTGICNSTSRTDKLVLGLSANTTYEWQMRVWYCSTGATAWVTGPNFTTLADCPNVGNLAVTTPTNTKATFTWDNSNGAYSFVRLQARVDTTGSSFFNIGGVGVLYGTYTKDKNGLVPGTSYRAKSRTWCDPNGGAYKAPSWTPFIYFTMPGSVRLDGGTSIESLDVYPNPSRDIFNVSFTSKEAQDLEVRVINVVGEVVYTEGLENFTGEYTKEIDLVKYTKGIYFLEITTNSGVINKKLILQ